MSEHPDTDPTAGDPTAVGQPAGQPGDAVLADLVALAGRLAGGVPAELELSVGGERRVLTSGPQADPAAPVLAVPVTSAGRRLGELRVRAGVADQDRARTDLELLARLAATCVEAEEAEARAFDATEAAASAEERLARVAGQLAHDLNNPLAAVAMSLEIARDQVEDPQSVLAALLERAAGSAARMKRMTADLLDYGLEPSDGTTDLQAELDAVLEALDGLLPGRVVRQRPLPVVPGHPGDHRVVLVGILENAVKFAADGEPLHLVVDAEARDGECRITFTDRGRGVPAEEVERVLEPTVRLDKRIPGLGLGLASARRIVTAQGGSIGVEPVPGGGTTVSVRLPLAQPRP